MPQPGEPGAGTVTAACLTSSVTLPSGPARGQALAHAGTAEQLDDLLGRQPPISAAAWRRFARDRFHQTSMHDILVESGLSAGAVYRYFSGKHELITTIALQAVT